MAASPEVVMDEKLIRQLKNPDRDVIILRTPEEGRSGFLLFSAQF